MKHLLSSAVLFVLSFAILGCGASQLSIDQAQKAVEKLLNFTKKGGTVTVTGFLDQSKKNSTEVTLRFDGFQYNADMMGVPMSRDQTGPQKPAMDSPNYWQEVLKSVEEQTGTKTYSGQGSALFNRNDDGTFVLTDVQFGLARVNTSVEVE